MQQISLTKIRLDGDTQPRIKIDDAVVQEYAQAYEHGVQFPPIVVYNDGKYLWLCDGYHRYYAAKSISMPLINAIVETGDLTACRWASAGSNQNHGLRRTNDDKQRAVDMALAARPELSDQAIADHVGVSRRMVLDRRNDKSPQPVKVSHPVEDAAPIKRVGTDGKSYTIPPIPRPPQKIVDEMGRAIPGKLLPMWARREEIKSLMRAVADVKNAVQKAADNTDKLFAGMKPQHAIDSLKAAHQQLSAALPYIVCPWCGGMSMSCVPCGGKGFVSKFMYDTAATPELRAVVEGKK